MAKVLINPITVFYKLIKVSLILLVLNILALFVAIEEGLEMIGIIVFIYGLLKYIALKFEEVKLITSEKNFVNNKFLID